MKVTVNPVCPDFQPLSMDTVTVKGVSDEPFSVKLVQHSPERKDLVLYDSAFPAAAADLYIFGAEPGDYTIYIGMDAVKDSAVRRIFQQDFTIENADFSENPQFAKTNMVFAGAYLRTEDSAPANPELLSAEVKYEDDIKNSVTEIGFPRYQRIRGDYNGDTAVDSADAQLTLNVYSETLAGNPSETLPAAAAACASSSVPSFAALMVLAMDFAAFSWLLKLFAMLPSVFWIPNRVSKYLQTSS